MRPLGLLVFVTVFTACTSISQTTASSDATTSISQSLRPLSVDTILSPEALRDLARAIGNKRIVLIGENGHGVAQTTTLKGALVRYLHENLDFDLVAFESGFAECDRVSAQIANYAESAALRLCLAYAFEHAELLPLFHYIKSRRFSGAPLMISGIDIQTQGNDSRFRPEYLRDALARDAPAFANRLAVLDSALQARSLAGGDSLAQWVRSSGAAARMLYDSAANATSGAKRWTLRTTAALLERLLTRDAAAAAGQPDPARFYELRDEWMARTISWLADSTGSRRKVVVWLHNDHARYGSWITPAGPVRATGAFLRAQYPGSVYSIGFVMGGGSVANNSRQVREMIAAPSGSIEEALGASGRGAGYLLLSNGANSTVRRWAQNLRPFLRNGLVVDSLAPAQEFDALFYIRAVTPPTYTFPPGR